MVDRHPLFPMGEDEDEDEEPPVILDIRVQRKENGKLVTAPALQSAEDLNSLAKLFADFGGGEYILTGLNEKRQIKGRVVHILPGKSKNMYDEVEELAPAPRVSKTEVLDPMQQLMGQGGGGLGGIMIAVMQMMQNQANQQTQMFIAMMSNNNQSSVADKAAQQAAYDRQRDADRQHSEQMMLMVKELASAKPSADGGTGDAFFKGVEFMRHFSTQQLETIKAAAKGDTEEGFSLEKLLESGMQALQTFNAFKEIQSGMAGGAAQTVAEVVSA